MVAPVPRFLGLLHSFLVVVVVDPFHKRPAPVDLE
jgi:hypothetical protein